VLKIGRLFIANFDTANFVQLKILPPPPPTMYMDGRWVVIWVGGWVCGWGDESRLG